MAWWGLHFDRDKPLSDVIRDWQGIADINTDRGGFTPLLIACLAHRADAVQWLVDRGANSNIVPSAGCVLSAPLYCAVPDTSCMAILLLAGARVEYRTELGVSALGRCVQKLSWDMENGAQCTEAMKLLMNHGADPRLDWARVKFPEWVLPYYVKRRRHMLRVLGAAVRARILIPDTRRLIMKNAK